MPVARDVTDQPMLEGPPQDAPVVSPTSFDPPSVENAPETSESNGTGDRPQVREFDPKYREPFLGLIHIGALDKSFNWLGHEFHIRTLTSDEVIAVGIITGELAGTLAENRAYMTAWVALAVQSVDGTKLPIPYQEEPGVEWARQRYNHVKARWYPYTVDFVYTQCLALEDEVREVGDAMGKAFRQAG